jgi:hypothetical protein
MTDQRVQNLLLSLIEETSRGRLSWIPGEAPGALTYATNDVFYFYAEANFRGTRFAIYELRWRHYFDEHEFYWDSSVNLSVLDGLDRVLWQVDGGIPEVTELFDDVRRKLSGIEGLLDQFR